MSVIRLSKGHPEKYNIEKKDTETSIYFNPSRSSDLDDIKMLIEFGGSGSGIKVYPNDEDTNPYNSYRNVRDHIYRIIDNTEFLCKELNEVYVLNAFSKVDAVIIIGSQMSILPNGNVFGFALIKFDQKRNSIYIDVICSHKGIKGAGDILIKTIEELCKILIMNKIYLVSVDNAITFYEKYGFVKKDSSCVDMCLMTKNINKNGGKKRANKKTSKQKNRKTTRKNPRKKF